MSPAEIVNEDRLLVWEAEVLRSIASRKPIGELLYQIATGVEEVISGSVVSILLFDQNSNALRHGAAPSLSQQYISKLDGTRIGPEVGSCGTAAFTKKNVIVSDIETNSLWERYREAARLDKLRACWSTPVLDASGTVLATFAVYYRNVRIPSEYELFLIERFAQIVGIALQHDRKEQELKISERRMLEAFSGAATGIAVTDLQGRFLEVNPAYCRMLEYSEEELKALDFITLTHPDDRQKNIAELNELISGKRKSFIIEKRYLAKGGRIVWVRLSVSIQCDVDGNPIQMIGIAEDVSSIHEAEERQAATERSMETFLSNLPGMAYRCKNDAKWTMLFVSDAAKSLTGFESESLIDNRDVAFSDLILPEDRDYVYFQTQQALMQRRSFQIEYRIRRADGSVIWVWEQGRADISQGSIPFTIEGYISDINLQKTAQIALAESQRQASAILGSVGEGIHGVDVDGNVIFTNQAALNAFGFEESELIGKPFHAMLHHHYPDGRDYPDNECPVHMTLIDGITRHVSHEFFFRKDGSTFPVEFIVSPVITEDDKIAGAVISFNDITKRLELEEQLRQTQRLESLGQLTGGVAHDFNNLLTVILGNAETLSVALKQDRQLQDLASMIVSAAQRGAGLTKALLSFARKQPLEPKAVDVSALLLRLQGLLVRVLGEHIELNIECENHLWNAVVDPSQLENAILNLVINARDAMPQGGRLTVEASNTNIDSAYANQHSIAGGDYVMIAISDNGSGISPNVISRVFEPFFTTKEKGKGTGLGLAMVYGFIKQSGGHINIYSEVDIGTTVKMYLPRTDGMVSEIEAPQDLEPKSVGETILLVEDDALVRTYASGMLNSLGYKVIEAGDGQAAYEIIKSGQSFDLLFTDVVMPGGMTGKQLADKARLIRPSLKVLYTSGYTESVSVNEGRLDSGELLLSKPYKLSELAQKIRLALA